MKRTVGIGFLACTVAFLLSGALDVRPASAQQAAVKIGCIYPIKTVLGKQNLRGSELAAEMINASGGVLGRPIQLVVYDDNFNPAEGVVAARRLVNNDNVSIILGPLTSVGMAVLKVAQDNDALYMTVYCKAPGSRNTTKGSGSIPALPWTWSICLPI